MKKAKLTLTINQELLARTKLLAKERGFSLSGLVEGFFERLLSQDVGVSQDNWVMQMDQLLGTIWTAAPDQTTIDRETKRDHDEFEQSLIDDLSQEFLK